MAEIKQTVGTTKDTIDTTDELPALDLSAPDPEAEITVYDLSPLEDFSEEDTAQTVTMPVVDPTLKPLQTKIAHLESELASRVQISRGLESDLKASANAVRGLQSELAGKTEAISQLEQELNIRQERLADIDAMLKERDATISNLAADISSKPASTQSLGELRESAETIRSLESQLGAKAERIRVVENDVERLKQKQAEYKRAAEDHKSAVVKLETTASEKSENSRLLEQELGHWKEKHSSLEQMSNSQDSGLAEMKSQLTSGAVTIRQLETELLTKTSDFGRQAEQLESAQSAIENWKQTHDELKQTLKTREAALKRSEALLAGDVETMQDLETELLAKNDDLIERDAEISQRIETQEALQQDLEQWRDKYTGLEHTLDSRDTGLAELLAQIESNSRTIEDLQTALTGKGEELAQAIQKLESDKTVAFAIEQERNEWKGRCSALEHRLSQREAKVIEFEEQLKSRSDAIDGLHAELAGQAKTIGSLESNLMNRDEALQARESTIREWQEKFAAVESRAVEKEHIIREMENELSAGAAEIVQKDGVIQEYERQTKVLNDTINAWQADVENLKEELERTDGLVLEKDTRIKQLETEENITAQRIQSLGAELAAKAETIAAHESVLSSQSESLISRDEEIAEGRLRNAKLLEDIAERDASAAQLETELDQKREVIKSIRKDIRRLSEFEPLQIDDDDDEEGSTDLGAYGEGGKEEKNTRLLVAITEDSRIEHPLFKQRMLIGRAIDNDLRIDNKVISKHHAQLTSDNTKTVLEDLNSTNGVYVNARRIKRRTLKNGDIIKLGTHRFQFMNKASSAVASNK